MELLQTGKIGFLRFVMDGDNAEDYLEWCQTHGTDPSDESAEFYVEQTDIDGDNGDVYQQVNQTNRNQSDQNRQRSSGWGRSGVYR